MTTQTASRLGRTVRLNKNFDEALTQVTAPSKRVAQALEA
jgi:hypothetical protein